MELHTWLGGFAATIIFCAAVLCTLFTVLRPWTLPLGELRATRACVSGTVIHHWCASVWGQHRTPLHLKISICFQYQSEAALRRLSFTRMQRSCCLDVEGLATI